MRQANLFEFLGELEEALRQEVAKQTSTEDTSPTSFESEDKLFTDEMAEQGVELDIPELKKETMTPIEKLITRRINFHVKRGTFPSADEAQAIAVLDQINRSWQS